MTFVTPKFKYKFIRLSKMDKILGSYHGNVKTKSWWELRIFNKTWKLFKNSEIHQTPTEQLSRHYSQCQDME